MKTLTIPEIACFFKANDHFLILTHRRPDGDTLGCAAALCRGLRSLGKTAAILENPQLTDKYRPYLEGLTVPSFETGMVTVSVDVASLDMLAKNAGFPVRLLLDHHGTNPGFAEEGLIVPEAAATGELIFDVVNGSIRQLLNPELTASWEKGLTYVAEGTITPKEYMEKLEHFVAGRTHGVLKLDNQEQLQECFEKTGKNYKGKS